jgi:hypothetical protein
MVNLDLHDDQEHDCKIFRAGELLRSYPGR